MTPSARVQAAIEILDLIIDAARNNGAAADRIIADWFRTRRFAGSGDRRAVRELTYRAIRLCGEVPNSGRDAILALARTDATLPDLFDGSRHGPDPIGEGEGCAAEGIAPKWLEERLAASDVAGEEAAALLNRAPLDLRVNSLKAERDALALPIQPEPTVSRYGLRLPTGTQVEQWPEYTSGQIEVQDTASQLVCEVVAAQSGECVIDLCAGAGGKTLALAADMQNRGTLLACDTDRGRLSRLAPRAERSGAAIVETLLLNPMREAEALAQWHGRADAVLIDAPCSGSGTWRRNPESRWRLTDKELTKLSVLQARLLDLAAVLVRPGGRLIYATCSVLDEEGADQIDAFLQRHPQFQADIINMPIGKARGSGIRTTPYQDDTDGFFVARLLLM